MIYEEIALSFQCHAASLHGILSMPHRAATRGILFIVGGPQYRIGSHRQFTLLARQFAAGGVPVMRFDYRGMGDSEGEPRDFTLIDEDICAALDCFFQRAPHMQEVVLWGLCDAAASALLYAHQDKRVTGLVLVNPWVRTEQGVAKAYLKHYYLQRLLDASLWKKIASGKLNFGATIRSLTHQINTLLRQGKKPASIASDGKKRENPPSLPEKMARGFSGFQGTVLFILCGNDLTAQEFSDLTRASPEWKKLMSASRVTQHMLPAANHTFSQRNWREQIGRWTLDWLKAP